MKKVISAALFAFHSTEHGQNKFKVKIGGRHVSNLQLLFKDLKVILRKYLSTLWQMQLHEQKQCRFQEFTWPCVSVGL